MRVLVCVALLFLAAISEAEARKMTIRCWDRMPDGGRLEISGSYEVYRTGYFADDDLTVTAPGVKYSFYTRNIGIEGGPENFRLDSTEPDEDGDDNAISLRHAAGRSGGGTFKIVLQARPGSKAFRYETTKGSCRFARSRADAEEGPADVATNGPKILLVAANGPKTFLPAEDMAGYSAGRGVFTLCPETYKGSRCVAFADGNRPGRTVTNRQLYAAEGTFKGGRAGGAEDTSLEFDVLLNSIGRSKQRVRYQFADLARGTSDGRHEGLICLGKAREEKQSFPTWESCAYVTELRAQRTGD